MHFTNSAKLLKNTELPEKFELPAERIQTHRKEKEEKKTDSCSPANPPW